jgi:hypothetical protein
MHALGQGAMTVTAWSSTTLCSGRKASPWIRTLRAGLGQRLAGDAGPGRGAGARDVKGRSSPFDQFI